MIFAAFPSSKKARNVHLLWALKNNSPDQIS